MKKILVLTLTFALILTLVACGNNPKKQNQANNATPEQTQSQLNNNNAGITREKALEIALQEAGLTESDIRDLDIELDRERGVTVWEVDFDHQNLEYSYDVNADTGAITKAERERD